MRPAEQATAMSRRRSSERYGWLVDAEERYARVELAELANGLDTSR